MKCKECGLEIDDDAKFCTYCGKPIRSDDRKEDEEDDDGGILGGLGEYIGKIFGG